MFDRTFEDDFEVVPEKERIVSVSQLNNFIKNLIEQIPYLERISVKGEISNCTIHRASGHIYFTLKDEGSLIKAVMFKGYADRLNFKLENGMKVVCHGKVNVFVRDGQYSLYVDNVKADGIGSLYEAFEKLKKKLEAEKIHGTAENAEYLEKSKVAIWIKKGDSIARTLKNLSRNPEKMLAMVENTKRLAKPKAAENICKILMEEIL